MSAQHLGTPPGLLESLSPGGWPGAGHYLFLLFCTPTGGDVEKSSPCSALENAQGRGLVREVLSEGAGGGTFLQTQKHFSLNHCSSGHIC